MHLLTYSSAFCVRPLRENHLHKVGFCLQQAHHLAVQRQTGPYTKLFLITATKLQSAQSPFVKLFINPCKCELTLNFLVLKKLKCNKILVFKSSWSSAMVLYICISLGNFYPVSDTDTPFPAPLKTPSVCSQSNTPHKATTIPTLTLWPSLLFNFTEMKLCSLHSFLSDFVTPTSCLCDSFILLHVWIHNMQGFYYCIVFHYSTITQVLIYLIGVWQLDDLLLLGYYKLNSYEHSF